MLSEEKRNKINSRGLYSHKIVSSWVSGNNKYWCRNWTFKPHFCDDGSVYMCDSYFNSWDSAREVTDENFEEWEFIFDFGDVRQISYYEAQKYNESDLYRDIAVDSGGYNCSSCIWVKKSAKQNIDKQIKLAEEELNSAKREVKWKQETLKRLIEEKNDLESKAN